ncbi:ribonuclease BN [miscellaneous Crenarchaeota group-1 archaeon SG8-32-3]|uniref:Ribonuclease BN n=1 Tax=miscellaneous Crenarchaeota group-1 archaeon SG8-32-3 TaxID=1685125 RepID=A0A0M0BTM2_9ARCH|nr:MAG: ribonuclease BN [miscellaneous Crenarchaeota group-1 archaeon SG8-32-3]
MAKTKVELIENFLVVWNPAEGSKLYKKGFYGKPLGIPKPKIPQFDVPLLLDLMEGLYLVEKGKITIHEGAEKRRVGLKNLRQKARQLYDEFDEKYTVYRDLRNSGLIVTPGIKFGCDFAVYKYGPGVEHAPYMVSVKQAGSDISATEIVKAGRLATTVRKRFIIAMPDLEAEKPKYLIFKWFKA